MKGYCMKCKTKKDMKEVKYVKMKNNRNAIKGKCSTCGTNMFVITK